MLPFPIKIYSFEIFTRASPGSFILVVKDKRVSFSHAYQRLINLSPRIALYIGSLFLIEHTCRLFLRWCWWMVTVAGSAGGGAAWLVISSLKAAARRRRFGDATQLLHFFRRSGSYSSWFRRATVVLKTPWGVAVKIRHPSDRRFPCHVLKSLQCHSSVTDVTGAVTPNS